MAEINYINGYEIADAQARAQSATATQTATQALNKANGHDTEIETLNTKVNALEGITPTVVSDASDMIDEDKIYVLTTDNNWYYYDGNQFTVGGVYNSDVTEEMVKWYLSLISSDGHSVYNPSKAVEGSLKSSDGSLNPNDTNYWVTDYISVDPTTIPLVNNNYFVLAPLYNNAPVTMYKYCFYDNNKNFIEQIYNKTSIKVSTDNTHFEEFAYVRLQFAKSVAPYENRNLLEIVENSVVPQPSKASRFVSVTNDNILDGTIQNVKFSKNLYINNVYNMLLNSIVPFTDNDIGFGTILSANGIASEASDKLCTTEITKIPSGTSFNFLNNWEALALQYNADGEYLGRFVSNWTNAINFTTEAYVKFVFRNTVIGNLNNKESVISLLSNINISKVSDKFTYYGEVIHMKNKYNSVDTGLRLAGQDSANYDGKIVTFSSNGSYKVLTIEGDLIKDTTNLDQVETYTPHANSACFGTEKYNDGDIFPVFYINAYNAPGLPKGTCYVYRLSNDLSNTLLQQIIIDFTDQPIWNGNGTNVRPYGNFVVDTDNNKLYAFTMIDSLNVTRFFKFNLPSLSAGSVVHLTENDIIEYFDVEWFYYLQGCCYYNGKIYASCGFTANDCKLYVVDLNTKNISSILPLGGFVSEPETVIVNDDELYVSSTNKLYKLLF